MKDRVRIQRLGVDHLDLARRTFALMTDVFGEASQPPSDAYLHALLARREFFALTALRDDNPVGGITAHALPMTRAETAELFIYDIAVRPDHQRQGVGRALVASLRAEASASGIRVAFVPADADDEHALNFYRALGGVEAAVRIFTFE
jgi:aminoglycoside 3-N-acetyltransferase I